MNTALALLCELRGDGVELKTDGSRLQVFGPSTILTPAIYQRLLYHKPELINLLCGDPTLGDPRAKRPTTTQGAWWSVSPPAAQWEEGQFSSGIRVQVRPDRPGHFVLFVQIGRRWRRRVEFSTPSADHAKRTAEYWYGPPLDGWHAIEGDAGDTL